MGQVVCECFALRCLSQFNSRVRCSLLVTRSQQKLLASTFLSTSVAHEQDARYKYFTSNCDVCTGKNSRA